MLHSQHRQAKLLAPVLTIGGLALAIGGLLTGNSAIAATTALAGGGCVYLGGEQSRLCKRGEHIFDAAEHHEDKQVIRSLTGILDSFQLASAKPTLALPADSLGASLIQAFDVVADGKLTVEYLGKQVGPAFIRVQLKPARGVKVSSLKQYAEDLKIQLGLENPPLISACRGFVGVDIPRDDRQPVLFNEFVKRHTQSALEAMRMLVGIDINGNMVEIDFNDSDTPHMLVGGTSGSGKTEWVRAAIASIVYRYPSDQVQIAISDMKRAKFLEFEGCQHLYRPIAKDPADALLLFMHLPDLMDQRYAEFERYNCADIATYLRKSGNVMPRIVVFSDETDDLMAVKEYREVIEGCVTRLGKKAREAGIHLVIASQRPSTDTITGPLKANLPARVALRCKGFENSMIILGDGNTDATSLLGKGDLIYCGLGDPMRLHSAFIPESERSLFTANPTEIRLQNERFTISPEHFTISPGETSVKREREMLERLFQQDIEPDTDDDVSPFHHPEIPPLNQPNSADLDRFREIVKRRNNGESKTSIIQSLWGVSPGKGWGKVQEEYEALIERYWQIWVGELIQAGKSDEEIILTIWVPAKQKRKCKEENPELWQEYLDRIQSIREQE